MNNDRNNQYGQQAGKNSSMDQDKNKKDQQAGKFGSDKQAGRFGSDKQAQGRDFENRGKEAGFSSDRDAKGSMQSPRGDRK